ncbi:MAG: exo-alpha-sialidase [Phycisphaeraceae bacterium]|nr:exo-alpha-sialidase [Phycisphaeraceae bacterium]
MTKRLTRCAMLFTVFAIAGAAHSVRASGPLFEHKDLFISGIDDVCQYRIPTLVTTNRGTLLAMCDARVEKGGDSPNNIDLVLKRSIDNGRTWSPQQVVVDFPGYEAACDPSMLVDRQTGTIWLFYDYSVPDNAGGIQITRFHAVTSNDDGQTWSAPRDLTDELRASSGLADVSEAERAQVHVQVAPGMGIQTRAGQLVVPVYTRQDGTPHARLVVSEDHGRTWWLGAPMAPQLNECQVAELSDGTLMLNSRRQKGPDGRAVGITEDLGRSWSQVYEDTTLIDSQCQASLIRFTDTRDGYDRNRLLFVNPAQVPAPRLWDGRRTMTIRLSYDEGKTWPVSKVIEPSTAAYSCLTVLPDMTIGLLYECVDQQPNEKLEFAYLKVRYARFNLEWLTDGRDALSTQPVGPLRVVAFGDSTTAPRKGVQHVYAERLAEQLTQQGRKVECFNAGVPLNDTEMARHRFADDVLARNPHVAIIQFGINDAAVDVWKESAAQFPRVPLSRYEMNLRYFITTLKSRGTQVILLTPNPIIWTDKMKEQYGKPPYNPDDPDGFNVVMADYVEAARRVAKACQVTLVDMNKEYRAYASREGQELSDLLLDSQHPNDAGHRLVADKIMVALEPLLPQNQSAQ